MENRLASITRNEAAFLLGVTPSQISRLKGQGLPVNADNRTFNARALLLWDAEREEAAAGCAETSATLQILAKWRNEKYKIARIDRREREGKLCPWSEIEREWAERVREVAAGLEAWSDRLPALLVNRSREDIHALIKSEVRELRLAYSRQGKYTPEPFDTDAFAADIQQDFTNVKEKSQAVETIEKRDDRAAVVKKHSKGAEDGGGNRQTD